MWHRSVNRRNRHFMRHMLNRIIQTMVSLPKNRVHRTFIDCRTYAECHSHDQFKIVLYQVCVTKIFLPSFLLQLSNKWFISLPPNFIYPYIDFDHTVSIYKKTYYYCQLPKNLYSRLMFYFTMALILLLLSYYVCKSLNKGWKIILWAYNLLSPLRFSSSMFAHFSLFKD